MAKRSLRMVCCLAAVLALAGCGKKNTSGGSIKRAAVKSEEVQFASPQNGDTIAVFDTSLGEVRAVLYPQYAPMAVENFVGLSQAGYYNETVLFRVEPGFAVEGGDASGEGTGGTTIWNGNGYPAESCDALRHYAGALCAAQDDTTGSCYSVFYVVAAEPDSVDSSQQSAMSDAGWRSEVYDAYSQAGGLPSLDFTDTVFGQVYEGMDVIDAMANASADDDHRPTEDIVIHSVSIETYGG